MSDNTTNTSDFGGIFSEENQDQSSNFGGIFAEENQDDSSNFGGIFAKSGKDSYTITEDISWNSEILEHISEDEFMSISSGTFGDEDSWFGFGAGREEKMQQRLYEVYNPEKDPNKIQLNNMEPVII